MKNKLVSNYFYNILYQMLIVILPLIITPYTLRTLQVDALKINTNTTNIIQWFVIFGIMGVNLYGNREIAKVREDKNKCSRTFFEICFMQMGSMFLATIAFIIYYYGISHEEYGIYLLIQAVTILSVGLDITWFFYGVEDFKKVSIRNIFIRILNVILIFTLIKGLGDILLFIIINVSMSLLGQFIMWFQLKDYLSFVKIAPKDILKHIKPNIALFIPTIAISIYSVLDITMIRVFYNPDSNEVVYYEQAQKFVKMFLFFVTSIGSVMLPRISNVFSKNDDQAITSYLNNTFSLSLYLAIPMIVGIFMVIDGFVAWFLPSNFYQVGFLIKCISPIILFISLSNVFGIQYLVPTGKTSYYTCSVVAGAIINFLVNFLFIPTLGALGATIGSVVAELVVTSIQYMFTRKTIRLCMEPKEFVKVLLSSIVMAVSIYLFSLGKSPSMLITISQITIGIVVYGAMLICLKSRFVISIFTLVRKRQG